MDIIAVLTITAILAVGGILVAARPTKPPQGETHNE